MEVKCPYCGKTYRYSNVHDSLNTPKEESCSANGRQMTLYICECDAVVGVSVLDDKGDSFYPASTEEI